MSEIGWLSCGMDEVPADESWMAAPEATRFRSMTYTKRRTEARLGRWAAKNAVARMLGLDLDMATLATIVIRNAADGAPEVHVGGSTPEVVIAMTDRADWAVAALVHGSKRIGCDLELIEPRSPRFVEDYFTPAEQALAASGSPDLLANLIWSAKESALKVLRTGLRRPTKTVEVDLDPGAEAVPVRWRPLGVTVDGADHLNGWWIAYGQFVLTVVSEATSGPPVSLEEPPQLASAVPGHAWLTDPLT